MLGLLLVVVALIGLLRLFPEALPDDPEGLARVIDGDSLMISGTAVRLVGVDAPEGQQTCRLDGRSWACGEAASRALRDKIAGRPVTCDSTGIDQYDRVLARCRVGGEDLNAWLVRNGWAVAFGAYSREQRKASSEKLGLWAGEFQRPQDWREDHPR